MVEIRVFVFVLGLEILLVLIFKLGLTGIGILEGDGKIIFFIF